MCPPLKYTDGRLRDKANVAPCNKAEGGGRERERKKKSSANGNNAPTSTTTNISVDVNKAVTFISPVLCY